MPRPVFSVLCFFLLISSVIGFSTASQTLEITRAFADDAATPSQPTSGKPQSPDEHRPATTMIPPAPIMNAAGGTPQAAQVEADYNVKIYNMQLEQLRFNQYISLCSTITVIAFGCIAFLIICIASSKKANPDQFLRSFIVIIIVVSALILMTAGYTSEQVAPAFGLFGTIVGYMLGRLNSAATGDAGNPPPQ